jgi:hypothetical protein
MAFVDPATGWFEIVEVPDKSSARIFQLFNITWLCRYPWPSKVRFDNGSKFKKDFIPLLKNYAIKPKPTMIQNPHSTIVERVHQVVENILRVKDLNNWDFDDMDPWGHIISEVV